MVLLLSLLCRRRRPLLLLGLLCLLRSEEPPQAAVVVARRAARPALVVGCQQVHEVGQHGSQHCLEKQAPCGGGQREGGRIYFKDSFIKDQELSRASWEGAPWLSPVGRAGRQQLGCRLCAHSPASLTQRAQRSTKGLCPPE